VTLPINRYEPGINKAFKVFFATLNL